MTNISKKKLNKRAEQQLFVQFVHIFSSSTKSDTPKLFEALFTDAEKVMFIKRTAILFLLLEGYSTYVIAKMLYVSDKTVRDVQHQLHTGRYDPMVRAIRKKSFNPNKFLDTLEMVLQAGMPSMGKDRWKWLDKNLKS